MQRLWNFIYKGKLIDVWSETWDEAARIATEISEELDELQKKSEEK